VISTAILTAAYAVRQPVPVSPPRTVAPSPDVTWNGEPTERAMVVDEAASVLESLRGRDVRFCTNSAGGVGVETEVSAAGFDLRRRCIAKAGGKINPRIGLTPWMIGSVTTAPGIVLGFGLAPSLRAGGR
jgi:hypothetical protein